MITGSLTTGCRLEIELTATDIREPIWRYVKTLEYGVEPIDAVQHGQPIVKKESLPNPRYIRLSFRTDFPDIVCIHQSLGLFPGLSLDDALAKESDKAPFIRKAWRDEHSIHVIWEGFRLDKFATSWKNLLVVLNDLGPISFGYTLGLHPDTFPAISAELLSLFGHMGKRSTLSNGHAGGMGYE
ncbi:MAG: hypothetical protein NPIRA04_03300 [Nitrospirales bacterium]|nr:MAG: hypothetical protein NPIRA04_03300 [Nitrospirales bacterium]